MAVIYNISPEPAPNTPMFIFVGIGAFPVKPPPAAAILVVVMPPPPAPPPEYMWVYEDEFPTPLVDPIAPESPCPTPKKYQTNDEVAPPDPPMPPADVVAALAPFPPFATIIFNPVVGSVPLNVDRVVAVPGVPAVDANLDAVPPNPPLADTFIFNAVGNR